MVAHEFDGEKYRRASRHRKEWGASVISGIQLSGSEKVLDLGCGDGVLTKKIADMGFPTAQCLVSMRRRV